MGATGTRLSLRPHSTERVERDAKLGRNAPRERELTSLSIFHVMVRESGASSIRRPLDLCSNASGILDRPVEPDDDSGELFDI
jgi:hypothetical protein